MGKYIVIQETTVRHRIRTIIKSCTSFEAQKGVGSFCWPKFSPPVSKWIFDAEVVKGEGWRSWYFSVILMYVWLWNMEIMYLMIIWDTFLWGLVKRCIQRIIILIFHPNYVVGTGAKAILMGVHNIIFGWKVSQIIIR